MSNFTTLYIVKSLQPLDKGRPYKVCQTMDNIHRPATITIPPGTILVVRDITCIMPITDPNQRSEIFNLLWTVADLPIPEVGVPSFATLEEAITVMQRTKSSWIEGGYSI